MNERDKIAITLKEYRRRMGWTQRELASAADLTSQQVSNFETGLKAIGRRTALRLATAFDCPLAKFWKDAP